MSILDKAIKEMKNYGDMGLPDGENGGGMGSQESKNPVVNAYRMNNILRRQQRAEEEESRMDIDGGMRDADMPDDEMGMDGEEGGMEMDMDMEPMDNEQGLGMDDEVDTEEMKAFFQDNPAPSDEEVMQYADERGIDMEQMRQEVYELIQSLLGDSDPVGDGEEEGGMEMDMDMGGEEGMGDEEDMGDEIEFSAPMNGGMEKRPHDEEEEAKAPALRDKVSMLKNNPKHTVRDKRFWQRAGRKDRSMSGKGSGGGQYNNDFSHNRREYD